MYLRIYNSPLKWQRRRRLLDHRSTHDYRWLLDEPFTTAPAAAAARECGMCSKIVLSPRGNRRRQRSLSASLQCYVLAYRKTRANDRALSEEWVNKSENKSHRSRTDCWRRRLVTSSSSWKSLNARQLSISQSLFVFDMVRRRRGSRRRRRL